MRGYRSNIVLPKEILGGVGEVLSSQVKEEKRASRKVFLGYYRSGDLESNFTQLLVLSNDCPEIEPWTRKKTYKYTSHEVQNKILKIMSLKLILFMT